MKRITLVLVFLSLSVIIRPLGCFGENDSGRDLSLSLKERIELIETRVSRLEKVLAKNSMLAPNKTVEISKNKALLGDSKQGSSLGFFESPDTDPKEEELWDFADE